MITSRTQKLIDKWIKTYNKSSNEDLQEIYDEDFKDKSTPRREEEKARKKAIEALLM